MPMELDIFTSGLSADLLPQMKKRFLDFSMEVEFHHDFKLDHEKDAGFCPIKLTVDKGHSTLYDHFGKSVLTGFELFFDVYNYSTTLKETQEGRLRNSKGSFLSKIFGKSGLQSIAKETIVERRIDEGLQKCRHVLNLNWQLANKSELRVSLFFAAILAELTDGIVYDYNNERYHTGEAALLAFSHEVKEFEDSFGINDFSVVQFEKWR